MGVMAKKLSTSAPAAAAGASSAEISSILEERILGSAPKVETKRVITDLWSGIFCSLENRMKGRNLK